MESEQQATSKIRLFIQELKKPDFKLRLDALDLRAPAKLIREDEFRGYFLGASGSEHYRLLTFVGSFFDCAHLVDIGTYKGCSALALSMNPANLVHTFDVADHRTLGSIASNVLVYHSDVLADSFASLLKSSPFILLDTFHDGTFERRFYQHLRDIGYNGLLMLDDIDLNAPMRKFWAEIEEEKYDLTSIGHHSGTGLVVFEGQEKTQTRVGDPERPPRYKKESYITAHPEPMGFWAEHPNRKILQQYASVIRGRVADVGCNHAASTYWLHENPAVESIVGVDINEEALKIARETFQSLKLSSVFLQADLASRSFMSGSPELSHELRPGSFDTIVSFHTLEHIFPEDVPQFLANVRTLLKPQGHLVISIPYLDAYPDPAHVGFYTEHALVEVMERAGFRTLECFRDDRFEVSGLLTGLFLNAGNIF